MTVQSIIEQKLRDKLQPIYLEVINESRMHNVPPGSESHFKLTVVTNAFSGKMLLSRHRIINELLNEELSGMIHALSMHTFTPEEWQAKQGQVPASPQCLGGSKHQSKS